MRIELPFEFLQLCQDRGIPPDKLLHGFIGDLCGLQHQENPDLNSHGSDEREAARAWLRRAEFMMTGPIIAAKKINQKNEASNVD